LNADTRNDSGPDETPGRSSISLIVATDRNGVIGKDGDLPWHLPADLAHFKRTTMGKPLIMGRRTHESIGRALPGRRNVVLSRRHGWQPAEGCELARDVDEALSLLADEAEVMIIGGEAIYAAFLPRADRLYLTLVDTVVVDGDARFPALDSAAWVEASRELRPADDRNAHGLSFRMLQRREESP